MPRRLADVDTERSGGITSPEIARGQRLDVDVERKNRIDDAIDHPRAGRLGVARDPCGESLLDRIGAR